MYYIVNKGKTIPIKESKKKQNKIKKVNKNYYTLYTKMKKKQYL